MFYALVLQPQQQIHQFYIPMSVVPLQTQGGNQVLIGQPQAQMITGAFQPVITSNQQIAFAQTNSNQTTGLITAQALQNPSQGSGNAGGGLLLQKSTQNLQTGVINAASSQSSSNPTSIGALTINQEGTVAPVVGRSTNHQNQLLGHSFQYPTGMGQGSGQAQQQTQSHQLSSTTQQSDSATNLSSVTIGVSPRSAGLKIPIQILQGNRSVSVQQNPPTNSLHKLTNKSASNWISSNKKNEARELVPHQEQEGSVKLQSELRPAQDCEQIQQHQTDNPNLTPRPRLTSVLLSAMTQLQGEGGQAGILNSGSNTSKSQQLGVWNTKPVTKQAPVAAAPFISRSQSTSSLLTQNLNNQMNLGMNVRDPSEILRKLSSAAMQASLQINNSEKIQTTKVNQESFTNAFQSQQLLSAQYPQQPPLQALTKSFVSTVVNTPANTLMPGAFNQIRKDEILDSQLLQNLRRRSSITIQQEQNLKQTGNITATTTTTINQLEGSSQNVHLNSSQNDNSNTVTLRKINQQTNVTDKRGITLAQSATAINSVPQKVVATEPCCSIINSSIQLNNQNDKPRLKSKSKTSTLAYLEEVKVPQRLNSGGHCLSIASRLINPPKDDENLVKVQSGIHFRKVSEQNESQNQSVVVQITKPAIITKQQNSAQSGGITNNSTRLSNVSISSTLRPQQNPIILQTPPHLSTREQLSALGAESTIRSDVLYKTIIRDMRKYFSKDFNTRTMFIKRKRYKCDQYFFMCLKEYLSQRFEEFGSQVIITNKQTQALRPAPEYVDLIFFLGCLLYPKDIELAMKNIAETIEIVGEDGELRRLSFKTIHSYLYSFSLEKLNNLVNLKYFAFFFCHYFKDGIVSGQRLERKPTMNKHLKSYTDACNLILTLCQDTLKRSIDNSQKKQAHYLACGSPKYYQSSPTAQVNNQQTEQQYLVSGSTIDLSSFDECKYLRKDIAGGQGSNMVQKLNSLTPQQLVSQIMPSKLVKALQQFLTIKQKVLANNLTSTVSSNPNQEIFPTTLINVPSNFQQQTALHTKNTRSGATVVVNPNGSLTKQRLSNKMVGSKRSRKQSEPLYEDESQTSMDDKNSSSSSIDGQDVEMLQHSNSSSDEQPSENDECQNNSSNSKVSSTQSKITVQNKRRLLNASDLTHSASFNSHQPQEKVASKPQSQVGGNI